MKPLLRFVGVSVVCAIALTIAAAAYMGALTAVRIEERTTGPYLFVYQEMSGHDAQRLASITTELHAMLVASAIHGARPFDVYGLRSTEVGFVLASRPSAEFVANLELPTRMREIPAERSMIARFPWRHQLSFLVGYLRVEPALRKHRALHGYRDGPLIR